MKINDLNPQDRFALEQRAAELRSQAFKAALVWLVSKMLAGAKAAGRFVFGRTHASRRKPVVEH